MAQPKKMFKINQDHNVRKQNSQFIPDRLPI